MKQKNVLLLFLFLISFQTYINTSWLVSSLNRFRTTSKISTPTSSHEYDGYLASDLDAYTSGYFINEDPENIVINNNVSTEQFENPADFEQLPFLPNCLFDVALEQSKFDTQNQGFTKALKKLDQEELAHITQLQTSDEISDDITLALETINNKKQELIRRIRDCSLLPILQINACNKKLPVYQLYQTKEFATEHKEIACGPYMIAYALAIHKILHQEQQNYLWKHNIEEISQKYFEPTDHTLDIMEVIWRVSRNLEKMNIASRFNYYLLNYDIDAANITLFDPAQFEELGNNFKTEEDIQQEIKQKIKKEIKTNPLYFMYRIGKAGLGMGHWSLFACIKNKTEQFGIFYLDNMNNFIDTTEKIAKYVQELLEENN